MQRNEQGQCSLIDDLEAHARVQYAKAPLERVVTQLRFDPLLEIETGLPADFQRAVREHFPTYQHQRRTALGPGGGVHTESVHLFHREDQTSKLVLTSGALAAEVVGAHYPGFDAFMAQFDVGLAALDAVYGITEFTRTGLRYVDHVPVDNADVPLSRSFHPALIAPFLEEKLGPCITASLSMLTVDFGPGRVTLRHGLDQSGPEVYVLDSDYWVAERLDRAAAAQRLELLHDFAWRFFRTCITDELHEAFEPHAL